MTLPNLISTARVLLVPAVMALILAGFDGHERWAAAVYLVAALSDSLDGYLARRKGWITVTGTFLDPLADKLLVSAALVCLVQIHEISAWVAMVVIAREFAVQGLRMVAAAENDVISASWLGKYKTLEPERRHHRGARRQLAPPRDRRADRRRGRADAVLVPRLRGAREPPLRAAGGTMSVGSITLGAVALIVASYGAGSMPWGYWMVRVFRHDDIRKHGSGNTGATNVWRTFGPRLGLPTLLLDIGKGAVPALLGRYWLDDDTIAVIAGAAAVVGHTFPVFLGLGGGKGVATATGVTFALAPYCGLVGAVGFVTVLWLFRYVSLASLTAAGTVARHVPDPPAVMAGDRLLDVRGRDRAAAPPDESRHGSGAAPSRACARSGAGAIRQARRTRADATGRARRVRITSRTPGDDRDRRAARSSAPRAPTTRPSARSRDRRCLVVRGARRASSMTAAISEAISSSEQHGGQQCGAVARRRRRARSRPRSPPMPPAISSRIATAAGLDALGAHPRAGRSLRPDGREREPPCDRRDEVAGSPEEDAGASARERLLRHLRILHRSFGVCA